MNKNELINAVAERTQLTKKIVKRQFRLFSTSSQNNLRTMRKSFLSVSAPLRFVIVQRVKVATQAPRRRF